MKPRVRASIVERSALVRADQKRMLALMTTCYERVDPARFFADLDDKHTVIVLRDRDDDTIVGFSTVRVDEETIDGARALVVFSGDTVVDPRYWGTKQLQLAFLRFGVRLFLTHPRHRVFWLLLSKGYKTYLLLANYCAGSVPRKDAPSPKLERFLAALAARRWPNAYDEKRGVLSFGGVRDRVRAGVAPIDRALMRNRNVAFFVERNPGYAHGDELVCLAEARVSTLLFGALRLAVVIARGFIPMRRRAASAAPRARQA